VPDDVSLGLVGVVGLRVPLVPFELVPMPEPVVLPEPVPELPLLPGVVMSLVPDVESEAVPAPLVPEVPLIVPLSLGAL
jgi:hypothetical protein